MDSLEVRGSFVGTFETELQLLAHLRFDLDGTLHIREHLR